MRNVLRQNLAMVRAIAVFTISIVVFFVFMSNSWAINHLFAPFTGLVAKVTTLTFMVAGQTASNVGSVVRVNGTSLSIAQGCNGFEAMAIYFAAVFALPSRWTRCVIGLAIGVVGIFIVNQVRVAGLFLIAIYKPEYLPLAHNYAGQTFVIVMGIALWIFWAETYSGFALEEARTAAR